MDRLYGLAVKGYKVGAMLATWRRRQLRCKGGTGAAEEKQDRDEQNMVSDSQDPNKVKREGEHATNARWRAIRFELRRLAL